nr:FAD-binding oxidoreductase [Terribacillus saccharophilus]
MKNQVYFPNDVNDIRDILNQNIEITVKGMGSKVSSEKREIKTLNMTQLNKVIEYNPVDNLITIEPGISIKELRNILSSNNQEVLLDHSIVSSGTVGGRLSLPGIFPFEKRHGLTSNQVQKITVATPRYGLTSFGANTLKNVAGYHVENLFVGSLGKLGILTSVTLKTFPIPKDDTWLIYKIKTSDLDEMDLFMSPLIVEDFVSGNPIMYIIRHRKDKILNKKAEIVSTTKTVDYIYNYIIEKDFNYLGSFKVSIKERTVRKWFKKNNLLVAYNPQSSYIHLFKSKDSKVEISNDKRLIKNALLTDPIFKKLKNMFDPRKVLI